MRVQFSKFRVQGLESGFSDKGSGSRVYGLEFGVWGSGLGVWGVRFRV